MNRHYPSDFPVKTFRQQTVAMEEEQDISAAFLCPGIHLNAAPLSAVKELYMLLCSGPAKSSLYPYAGIIGAAFLGKAK